MLEEGEFAGWHVSVHYIIAITISIIAGVWAYYRLKEPTIVKSDGNDGQFDAEIIDGVAYM